MSCTNINDSNYTLKLCFVYCTYKQSSDKDDDYLLGKESGEEEEALGLGQLVKAARNKIKARQEHDNACEHIHAQRVDLNLFIF